MGSKQIGKWAFIAGLVLSLATGLIAVPQVALGLFALGLVVGLLNVTAKETDKFLLAAVALMVGGVASIQTLSVLGTVSLALNTMLASFIAFAAAASLVVAIKSVISLGQ